MESDILHIDEKEIQKLLRKWSKIRSLRVKNEYQMLYCVYDYSYTAHKIFSDFVSSLLKNEFSEALNILESFNKWTENWLKDMWTSLGNNFKIKSLWNKKDWTLLQSIIIDNADSFKETLFDMTKAENQDLQFVSLGALLYLLSISSKKKTLRSIYFEDIDKTTEMFTQYIEEIGELNGRSLYGVICLTIPWQGKISIPELDIWEQVTNLTLDLWKELRNGDINQSLSIAGNLKETARKGALYYAKMISKLQFSRSQTDDVGRRSSLLKEEFEITKKMKRCGLDYAIGLYFTGILGLAKDGYKKFAEEEVEEAQKLPFEVGEEWEKISIDNLVKNPNKYDGKIVQIEGMINNIKEKKMRVGQEAVFTTFDMQSNSSTVELYFPRFWLKDNGLIDQSYGEFCGTFNKLCEQAKRPDFHIKRLSYEERKDKDWMNRCKWLVRDWWDGFTDRTSAEWTLGSLNPSIIPHDIKPTSKEVLTEENLNLLKQKYPSIRAALRAFKHILSDPITRNFAHDYLVAMKYHYDRNMMIDSLIYMAITRFTEKKKKIKASRIKFVSKRLPWFGPESQEVQFVPEIETLPLNISQFRDWLLFELEYINKMKEKA